jgi:hypothetical protein
VRVLGSVARGEDTESSDIDLLVDLDEDVGLVALARLRGPRAPLTWAVRSCPARRRARGVTLNRVLGPLRDEHTPTRHGPRAHDPLGELLDGDEE